MSSSNNKDNNKAAPDDMDDMERRLYQSSGINAIESDEDGGIHTRFEVDSDFSMDDEEEHHHHATTTTTSSTTTQQQQQESWAGLLTTHRKQNNTGTKGVLADFEEAKRIQARRNETAMLKAKEAWKQSGTTNMFSGESLSLAASLASSNNNNSNNNSQHNNNNNKKKKKSTHETSDDDDEDDEFVKQFRAQRIAELRSVSGLPIYGKLLSVGKFEFVDEVDQSDPRTYVVVHLYEDYFLSCRRMNTILTSLAGRYPHVKFLKLLATEADQTLSHSLLPAFLVYRGGKLVGNATINATKNDFANEMFTEEDVEWFLITKYGVQLPGVDVSSRERKQVLDKAKELDEQQQQQQHQHQYSIASNSVV
jgi:hypothetical protein